MTNNIIPIMPESFTHEGYKHVFAHFRIPKDKQTTVYRLYDAMTRSGMTTEDGKLVNSFGQFFMKLIEYAANNAETIDPNYNYAEEAAKAFREQSQAKGTKTKQKK